MHPSRRSSWPYEKTDPDEFFEKTKRGGNRSGEWPPFDWVSWDFVGWREHGGDTFLFKVKIGRPGIRPDGLRSEGRKGMDDLGLRQANRVGFQPLLVKVQLTEDGNSDVWDEEIFVPEVSNK